MKSNGKEATRTIEFLLQKHIFCFPSFPFKCKRIGVDPKEEDDMFVACPSDLREGERHDEAGVRHGGAVGGGGEADGG